MKDAMFIQVEACARPQTAAAGYRLWLPPLSGALRVLFVVNQRGAGLHLFQRDAEWRSLVTRMAGGMLYCEFESATVQENGYGQSMVHACEQFARLVGRPELATIPWILWGHSMGGRAVQDFVRWQPERVAAFCIAMRRYPTPAELTTESRAAMKVPGLYLMGADDLQPPDIRAHFERARAHDAPRAWAVLPGQGHWPPGMGMTSDDTSAAAWRAWAAHDLLIPWIETIISQRMATLGLVELDTRTGWLGDSDTSLVAPDAECLGDRKRASWFPDEAVARRWAQVVGGVDSHSSCIRHANILAFQHLPMQERSHSVGVS